MKSNNPKILILVASLMLFWHSLVLAQNDSCAVSLNMWLIGETCVVSGLQLQYGELQPMVGYEVEDDGVLHIRPLYRLAPIGLASKARDLGWFKSRFLIEFSLMQTWRSEEAGFDTINLDGETVPVSNLEFGGESAIFTLDSIKTEANLELLLTEDQYNALISLISSDFSAWTAQVTTSYEYLGIGYSLSTKNSLFRAGLGIGLIYSQASARIHVYEKNNRDINKLEIFDIGSTSIRPMVNLSVALYEGENLTVFKAALTLSVLNPNLSFYAAESSNGETEFLYKLALMNFNIVSWAFHF